MRKHFARQHQSGQRDAWLALDGVQTNDVLWACVSEDWAVWTVLLECVVVSYHRMLGLRLV